MRVRLPPHPPVLNFRFFGRPIRPREARKGMETLARRALAGGQNFFAANQLKILSITSGSLANSARLIMSFGSCSNR